MRPGAKALVVLVIALGVAAAIFSFSCEATIATPDVLTGPRILAIRSTPVDLVPGEAVTLDALVYAPPGSPQPTYQWSWCAALGATLQCAVSADQLGQLLDDDASGTTVNYSLGGGAKALFVYPVSPTVIEEACDRRSAILLDAGFSDDGGLLDDDASSPVALLEAGAPAGLTCSGDSWTVYVQLTVQVGGTTLQAVRNLTAYLDVPTETNSNPTIDGLLPFATLASLSDGGALANAGDESDGAVLDAGVGGVTPSGVVLAAEIPESASEIYTTRALQDGGADLGGGATSETPCEDAAPPEEDAGDAGGSVVDASTDASDDADDDAGAFAPLPSFGNCSTNTAGVHESLTLAWYAGGGTLARATTTLLAARVGAPQDWSSLLLNPWAPPSQAGTTPIILVVRDNRGGVGWWVQSATVPVR
jgi:hypothetical protein